MRREGSLNRFAFDILLELVGRLDRKQPGTPGGSLKSEPSGSIPSV